MGFTSPIGLFALLAIPAVIFLHLFRQRFRERRVAGLFLFAPDALPARAGNKRTRLLKTPSFWLEIAAALLLALWLGGFTVGAGHRVPHLVVIWDDSASMGADGVPERARAALEEALDELPGHARGTLIVSGTRPEVRIGPRAPAAFLRDAFDALAPRQPQHDLRPSLLLGRELAGDEGRLLLLTDRPFEDAPPRATVRAVGAAQGNAAVLSARRDGTKVYFDLMAFADGSMRTRFTIHARDRELRNEEITLPPGRLVRLSFGDPGPQVPVRFALGDDALAIDNAVTLLPSPTRVVPVATAMPDETRTLLALDEVLDVLPAVRVVGDRAQAALVIADAPLETAPGQSRVVIRPSADETDAWVGPFLLEHRHPLLRGVTLEGIVWTAGNTSPPGAPLALAGELALICEQAAPGGALRLAVNLDAKRSNVAASPDWPILWSNVVEHVRRRLPGPAATNVRLGELMSYRGRLPDASLVGPDGATRPARGTAVYTWVARKPGVHRLIDADGRERARWSAHFVDAAESDLREAATATRAPIEEPTGGTEQEGDFERTLLALLLLAVLTADWWVLS
ncbi:MAG: BatA and WFA domain-containing protein [Planctomycetota bacterium]